MSTYATIEVEVDEIVCIDALIHDRMSAEFARGVVYMEAEGGPTRLHWQPGHTSTLLSALKALNSFQNEDGAARRLVSKINRVSNA